MHKAPARVLVTLLLLLLGTAAACSSVASDQGDSQDALQLRKLLQSEFAPTPIDIMHHQHTCCIIMQGGLHGCQWTGRLDS